MQKTTVFRFRYFDRSTGRMELADDWATPEAIADIGGVIEPGSAIEVDVSQVSTTSGLLIWEGVA